MTSPPRIRAAEHVKVPDPDAPLTEDPERRRKLVDILERAIDFTTDAQTDRGGWGYVSAKDGGGFDEGSVTITQVQGLRAARNAGISFDIKKGGTIKHNGEVKVFKGRLRGPDARSKTYTLTVERPGAGGVEAASKKP